MTKRPQIPQKTGRSEVDSFLAKVATTPVTKTAGRRGRLLFAMDATASREPTWDQACHIQAEMFTATSGLGGLDVQLCYFRGFHEFYTTPWVHEATELLTRMTSVQCVGGMTQIEQVLEHTGTESRSEKVDALVLVGDAMEEELDRLCGKAGELGVVGTPAFVFQEGYDATAERAFREIARLSNGAYCRFDAASAAQLRDLLSAVAVYAAGGAKALQDFSQRRGGMVRQLTHQMGKN